jgi:hypothetical protein
MSKKEQYTEMCDGVSDYMLDIQIKGAAQDVKAIANKTIINKWLDGKLLTFEQLQMLKLGKVDGFEIGSEKKVNIYVPKYDKKVSPPRFLKMEKEDRYVNRHVIGVDKRIKNSLITDPIDISDRAEGVEENLAELSFKNSDLHDVRAHLSGLRGVMHTRKEAALREEREKLGRKRQSLKEIWVKANKVKVFTEAECEVRREPVEPTVEDIEPEVTDIVEDKDTLKLEVPMVTP